MDRAVGSGCSVVNAGTFGQTLSSPWIFRLLELTLPWRKRQGKKDFYFRKRLKSRVKGVLVLGTCSGIGDCLSTHAPYSGHHSALSLQ